MFLNRSSCPRIQCQLLVLTRHHLVDTKSIQPNKCNVLSVEKLRDKKTEDSKRKEEIERECFGKMGKCVIARMFVYFRFVLTCTSESALTGWS